MAPRLIGTGIPALCPMIRSGEPEAHISHSIRRICLALGHFEDNDQERDPNLLTRWELGSAFERAVINGLAQRYAEDDPFKYAIPGELECEGMLGTPDLLDIADQIVVEIKLTWASSRHDPESEKFWRYWLQGKCYAYMMGWKTVRVHVGHIMGNYKDDRGPVYNVWEDTFTQQQLLEAWRMVKSNRAKVSKVGI